MKPDHSFAKTFSIKTLAAAIAACAIAPPLAHAGPTGGVVVDGTGSITQTGVNTQVDQVSDRLSLEWDTFNVGRNERVQFVQPSADAIALNRILDNSGSQILGRIDANGQVILMNPNGIIFGRDAVINVGGLVASGLNISSDDFMNGDLVFIGLEGTAGTVVNRGIINAALGGNVALLGKGVTNQGFISAELGHVALASGTEAIVTFDNEGLLGVRIDQATLAEELGTAYAVNNSGTIEAKGGKILLSASASADLFSAAVNSGGMGNNGVEFHDDGSFSVGVTGNDVINSGRLNTSTDESSANDAGIVILAGDNIEHRGTISANASGPNKAGAVYFGSSAVDGIVKLAGSSQIEAIAENKSGKISIAADQVLSTSANTALTTSGNTYLTGDRTLRMPKTISENLLISSLGVTTQTGPAEIAGVLQTRSAGGVDICLTNSGNDFNEVRVFTTSLGGSLRITDRNDVVIGETFADEASLRVTALGEGATISQVPGTRLYLSAGTLSLNADNVVLGEGGATTVHIGGRFYVDFSQSIATNGSISMSTDTQYPSVGRFRGVDRIDGDVLLDLRGNNIIDLNADIMSSNIHLHGMTGARAVLGGAYIGTSVRQTAPINLSGTLTLNTYDSYLSHPDNDIASLEGRVSASMGALSYVDRNDVVLRNLSGAAETVISVTSLGAGATLRQASGTSISIDVLDLKADNIILGANGSSSMDLGSTLNAKFKDRMVLNGPWSIGTYEGQGPFMTILGDEGDNRLHFGPYATNNGFSGLSFFANLNIDLGGGNDTAIFESPFPIGSDPETWIRVNLNMGEGNDRVIFNQSVQIPLILGEGLDVLRVRDNSIFYDVLDFDPSQDQLVIVTP
jgi:filamentous haemagglutinin family N-terminal domain